MSTEIKIVFASEEAAKEFAVWMTKSGGQSYWDWMSAQERFTHANITAVKFEYHGKLGNKEFMEDWTIRTSLGRISDE